jgi:hypothetical protein
LYGTSNAPLETISHLPTTQNQKISTERRKAVFQHRKVSFLTLGEFDLHVSHMARLDAVLATLSLGGLCMAVSEF